MAYRDCHEIQAQDTVWTVSIYLEIKEVNTTKNKQNTVR